MTKKLYNFQHSPLSVARVRLANGSNSSVGRIEVFARGSWGTVCDDDFDISDANVFCRMLGFSGAQRVFCSAKPHGQGSGPIWINNLRCVGNEKSIDECPHNGTGRGNCTHREDVGVSCSPFNISLSPQPITEPSTAGNKFLW